MRRAEYKYKLHVLLRKMSVENYEAAMTCLPRLLNVSRPTFRKWIYMKEDSGRDIPADALLKLAIFFEVSPRDMYSKPINPAELKAKYERLNEELCSQLTM